MRGSGEHCPIAQASEVLALRWMPLVARELVLAGHHRFNEIHRGIPAMSGSLLATRLRQLEAAGVVERRRRRGGTGHEYHLTRAGEELRPVLEDMGAWGARWLQPPVRPGETDAARFMWSLRATLVDAALPAVRVTVQFRFSHSARASRTFWLVLPEGDVCSIDPGFAADVRVAGALAQFARVWSGHMTLDEARTSRAVIVSVSARLVADLPRWFGLATTEDRSRDGDDVVVPGGA